jgi:hypothetical protein
MLGIIVGGAIAYVFIKIATLPPREVITEVARGSNQWMNPQDTIFYRGNGKPESVVYETDPVTQLNTAIITWPGGYLQRAQVNEDGQIMHPYFLNNGQPQ